MDIWNDLMRFVFRTHSTLHECLIGIRIDGAGSVWDPFPGAHHLLEHLLSKKIEETLTQLGGHCDAFTYREYQTLTLAVPQDRIVEAVQIVSQGIQAVCEGRWMDNEQIHAIHILHQERLTHLRNPHEQLMEALDEAILCPAYARPTSAIEPPSSLHTAQLAALARQTFHDERVTVVCVAPDDQTFHLVERSLNLPRFVEIKPLIFPQCSREARTLQTASPSKEEFFIRFDFPGYGAASTFSAFNRIASALLAGSNGLLRRVLGEAGGARCYDLFSDTAQFAFFGQVNVGAACAPEDLEHVSRRIIDEVARLHEDPFFDADRWDRLFEDTKKDVKVLQNNPYDLFEFLLDEAHPCFCGDIDPQMLLVPWDSKRQIVKQALRVIFNPNTISMGKTITSARG